MVFNLYFFRSGNPRYFSKNLRELIKIIFYHTVITRHIYTLELVQTEFVHEMHFKHNFNPGNLLISRKFKSKLLITIFNTH